MNVGNQIYSYLTQNSDSTEKQLVPAAVRECYICCILGRSQEDAERRERRADRSFSRPLDHLPPKTELREPHFNDMTQAGGNDSSKSGRRAISSFFSLSPLLSTSTALYLRIAARFGLGRVVYHEASAPRLRDQSQHPV